MYLSTIAQDIGTVDLTYRQVERKLGLSHTPFLTTMWAMQAKAAAGGPASNIGSKPSSTSSSSSSGSSG